MRQKVQEEALSSRREAVTSPGAELSLLAGPVFQSHFPRESPNRGSGKGHS